MNDVLLTKHQQRIKIVRSRLNRVVRHLDPPTGRGNSNTDGYTTFAIRMSQIASERGVVISKQRDALVNGTPRDLSAAIRRLGKGKSGLTSARLDLIDATCEVLERELQAHTEHVVLPQERPPMTPPPTLDPTPPEPHKLVQPAAEASPLDLEIAAMPVVYEALKPLTQRARQRVTDWAIDMFMQQEAENA